MKKINVKVNENRRKVLNYLKEQNEPKTLKQISEILGFNVSSGTTEPLATIGVLVKCGKVEQPRIVYDKVETYKVDTLALEKWLNENK